MSRLAGACASLLLVLCTSCASVRVRHARDVGTAGAEWAKATDALLRAAEETAVDADSARALSEAQGLSKETRREALAKHGNIGSVIADLQRLRRHVRLLARYFERVHDLSDDARDTAAEDATTHAADAVVALGKELSGSTLLTAAERDAISKTAGLAVRASREAALSRELATRGETIARELQLEQTLLEAVRRMVRADAATVRDLGLARDVVRPYVDGAVSDAPGWIALRRSYVLPPDPSQAIAAAGDAASRLRSAWAALVEGRFDSAAWSAISADSETLASYAELLEKARR